MNILDSKRQEFKILILYSLNGIFCHIINSLWTLIFISTEKAEQFFGRSSCTYIMWLLKWKIAYTHEYMVIHVNRTKKLNEKFLWPNYQQFSTKGEKKKKKNQFQVITQGIKLRVFHLPDIIKWQNDKQV